jgi:hypothetical protein
MTDNAHSLLNNRVAWLETLRDIYNQHKVTNVGFLDSFDA